jgi:ribosomal protein L40E
MTTCPKCGAENKPDSTVCRMCATPLVDAPQLASPDEVLCPKCGAANEPGWAFCLQCGGKLPLAVPDTVEVLPADLPAETPPAEPPKRAGSRPTAVEVDVPVAQAPVAVSDSRSVPPTADRPQGAANTMASSGTPCPQCHSLNAAESSFCYSCGAPLRGAVPTHTRVMSSIPAPPGGRLHLIMEGGQPGEVFDLKEETVIGRTAGDISFAHDGFMSSRHARIVRRGAKFVLKDEGSRNGTYIRIEGEIELKPGDMILIGKQVFRFEV